MTNDKKAHQIAWKYTKHYDSNCCKQECVEMGAKEMAIWKDQQVRKYINGCIKTAQTLNHEAFVQVFKVMIKDLGL